MKKENIPGWIFRKYRSESAFNALNEALVDMEVCTEDGMKNFTERGKGPLFALVDAIHEEATVIFDFRYPKMKILDIICKQLGEKTPPKMNPNSYSYKENSERARICLKGAIQRHKLI